jgi:hypothetical protein
MTLIQTIKDYPPGRAFSAHDFSGIALRNTIDQTLLRLAKKGTIEKIAHGIFSKPKTNPLIGAVPPSVDDLIKAYGDKFGYQIQVHPAKAANMLGLSQYVVAQPVYLTDAPSKRVQLGAYTVKLQHVCPRKLLGIGTKAGLIIQSLYYFGKSHLDDAMLLKIQQLLDKDTKNLLTKFFPGLPGWMQTILLRIGITSHVH